MPNQVDFLIAGQGLAGSLLAFELLQSGASIAVVDTPMEGAASPVAAGIVNPVSGKRLTVEPDFQQKLAALANLCARIESMTGAGLLQPLPQTRLLSAEQWADIECRDAWPDYLDQAEKTNNTTGQSRIPVTVSDTWRLDIPGLLTTIREQIRSQGLLLEERIRYEDIQLTTHGVEWKNIHARHLIFCEGWRGQANPWFNTLPFNLNKGQVLELAQPQPDEQDDQLTLWGYWRLHTTAHHLLGATTERDYQNLAPDAAGKNTLLEAARTAGLDVEPHVVLAQRAGIRPATLDRLPFIGLHYRHQQIGIFNGFGGKGALNIPVQARAFARRLATDPANHTSDHQRRLDRLLRNGHETV